MTLSRGHELYQLVKALERDWLYNHVRCQVAESILPILLRAENWQDGSRVVQDQSNERRAAGERFLSVLKETWQDHLVCMGMITDVLMYMVSRRKPKKKK